MTVREQVRLSVYRRFAYDGRPPTVADLVDELDSTSDSVVACLQQLADERHLVLRAGGDGLPQIVMAHPFSAVPLGFSVMGPRTLWWGGCAWDSFAVPHLVPDTPSVLVATQCPACQRPHAFQVAKDAPPPGEQVAHFLVPAARMWDDVVHACANQRIFCSPACVDDWLASEQLPCGYVMDLETLWRLASHWYDGRLQPGYTRREPADAREYLESVGLSGPFWGH
ncbi:MAG: hypothetical protein QOC82_2777 [Frankiaceae bacterium]|nr:hypothetical protein [Frankiaceae bacterium]